MKIREMDIYFTVPVNRAVLAACRKQRGFSSAAAFDAALKEAYPINYVTIEYPMRGNKKDREFCIRGDVAEVIAAALGMEVGVVFPAYDQAKEAAEYANDERYYKPFTTLAERNAAIVETMDVAKYTAFKYGYKLEYQYFIAGTDKAEAISIAYEALVYAADRALKKGIPKSSNFAQYACTVIRNTFEQMRCKNARKYCGSYTYSYDDLLTGETSSGYNLENEVIANMELERLAQALPGKAEESAQDKLMQEMEKRLQEMKAKKESDARARAALEDLGYA